MAMKIREIARANDIYIIPAPPLARRFITPSSQMQQIPDVVCLSSRCHACICIPQPKQYRKRGGERPKLQDSNMPIPPWFYVIRSIAWAQPNETG